MSKLDQIKARALQDERVRYEYELLAPEFELIDQLLHMRNSAGLTQDEVAQRMGTKKSNISRLEKGNTNPSWNTLRKYAAACGFKISVSVQSVQNKQLSESQS